MEGNEICSQAINSFRLTPLEQQLPPSNYLILSQHALINFIFQLISIRFSRSFLPLSLQRRNAEQKEVISLEKESIKELTKNTEIVHFALLSSAAAPNLFRSVPYSICNVHHPHGKLSRFLILFKLLCKAKRKKHFH